MKNNINKRNVGRITLVLVTTIIIFVFAWSSVSTQILQAGGVTIGENKIPIGRDKASAPYAIFQSWLTGSNTGKCYDDATHTIKSVATYANCAIRATQDGVTKIWWIDIPSELPSGNYIVIIRDGADGAEANTDVDVSTIVIGWDKGKQMLKTVDLDVLASY